MDPSPDVTHDYEGWDPPQAVEHVRELSYEVGFVFTQEGDLLLARRGGDHAIWWSDDDCERMVGCIVIHNHPSGDSFSLDDLELAIECDIAVLAVATHDRNYTMTAGAAGWPHIEDLADAYDWRIDQVQEDVDAGTVAPDQFAHTIWERVSPGLDLTYTAVEVP